MPVSPNINNYRIPKGIVYIKIDGEDSDWRDIGNCIDFGYAQDVNTKEHLTAREGIAKVDFEPVTKVGSTVKWVMDEITKLNLAIFVGADMETDSDGNTVLLGLTKVNKTGSIKVVGTNEIGPKWDFEAVINIIPSGEISLLTTGDDFQEIPLSAKVSKGASEEYGKWTLAEDTSA